MKCDFGSVPIGRVSTPISVRCVRCNRVVTASLFPVHAECGGNDLEDYIASRRGVGLGDVVAIVISTMTFGLVKSTEGCGCAERRKKLNDLMRFGGAREA